MKLVTIRSESVPRPKELDKGQITWLNPSSDEKKIDLKSDLRSNLKIAN